MKRRKPGAGRAWPAPVATTGLFATILGALVFSFPSFAAGIDSRTYTCPALQSLIISQGFIFISSPAFGDFVVADVSHCSRGSLVQLRSVPTTDQPECLVNYCMPADGSGSD
ncbi:MAG: hypothetical protein WA459_21020 [Stellaceae bacterium]